MLFHPRHLSPLPPSLRTLTGPTSAAPRALFHSSRTTRREDDNRNHYDTLGVSPNASPVEIKKRYFALSKTHHPDHNPNDPTAARRFVRVSEAYVVLGSTEKRQRYDREQLRSPQSGPQSRPAGSHSSTSGPAGGRSPSGLSRRRTHFKGPPPSFYRSGQWGAQREKRQRAAAAGADTPGRTTREAASDEAAMDDNDVPHFDRAGHFRTQEEQDRRRQRRLAEEVAPSAPGIGSLANFLFVGGIITLAIALPSLFSAGISRRAKHDDERVSK